MQINCPVCLNENTRTFIIEDYFLAIFPSELKFAADVPVKDLNYSVCNFCGHTYILNSLYSDYIYSESYLYYPFKGEWQIDYVSFEKILRESVHKKLSKILEIGSNDFKELTKYKQFADKVFGISLDAIADSKENISLIKNDFLKFEFDMKFDLVISRFVLEHISDLQAFVTKIHSALGEEGVAILQFPNPAKMKQNGLLNIAAHEHLHYFTKKSIYHLFEQNKFVISNFSEGESFIVVIEKGDSKLVSKVDLVHDIGESVDKQLINKQKIQTLAGDIKEKAGQSKVVLYGTALNLIGILHTMPILGNLDNIYFVDDNPLNTGKYMPHSTRPINLINELALPNHETIVYILASRIYHSQIAKKLNEAGFLKYFDVDLLCHKTR